MEADPRKVIAMSTEIKVTFYCAAKEGEAYWRPKQREAVRRAVCPDTISHLGRKEGNPANISSSSDHHCDDDATIYGQLGNIGDHDQWRFCPSAY